MRHDLGRSGALRKRSYGVCIETSSEISFKPCLCAPTLKIGLSLRKFPFSVSLLQANGRQSVLFLVNMTSEQRDAITSELIREKYVKDHPIVNEGNQADSFYIIVEVSNFDYQFCAYDERRVKCA